MLKDWKPTVIGAAGAAPSPTKVATDPPAAPKATPKFEVSALPGQQRRGLLLTEAELAELCPDLPAEARQKTRHILASVDLSQTAPADWLNFASDAQSQVSSQINQRLQLAESPPFRTAPRHLARLHTILTEIANAFEPKGLIPKRSPRGAWDHHKQEITQLQTELASLQTQLSDLAKQAEMLRQQGNATRITLDAHIGALDLLLKRVSAESAEILQARQTSLARSIAILEQHNISIDIDLLNTRNLLTHIQDGILIHLPSVITTMTSLGNQSTDTERYVARDKIAELVLQIGRKP